MPKAAHKQKPKSSCHCGKNTTKQIYDDKMLFVHPKIHQPSTWQKRCNLRKSSAQYTPVTMKPATA